MEKIWRMGKSKSELDTEFIDAIIKKQTRLGFNRDDIVTKLLAASDSIRLTILKYATLRLSFTISLVTGAIVNRTDHGLVLPELTSGAAIQKKKHLFQLIQEAALLTKYICASIDEELDKYQQAVLYYNAEAICSYACQLIDVEATVLAADNGPDMICLKANNINLYLRYTEQCSICSMFKVKTEHLSMEEKVKQIKRCFFHRGEGVLANSLMGFNIDTMEFPPEMTDIYFLGSGTCNDVCAKYADYEKDWVFYPIFFTYTIITELYNHHILITSALIEHPLTPVTINGTTIGWEEEHL